MHSSKAVGNKTKANVEFTRINSKKVFLIICLHYLPAICFFLIFNRGRYKHSLLF